MDGDWIVPSTKIRPRKKIGMAATKTNYNGKHHLSQKYKGPKQDALKLWTTKSPKTHRSLIKRHKLTDIQVREKSTSNGKWQMERLNTKYNLDCFSDSELDSESDEGEEYKFELGYEHLSKLRALFIIQEFVILLLHHDPWLHFLKSDLPFFFL